MKFCSSWIEEWLKTPVEPQALAETLTMAGLEVDKLSPAAAPSSGVVVGHVRHVAAHPNAERLKLCEVDAGGAKPVTVVCGADNVHEDAFVPFAPVGAWVNGLEIGEAEIRGVVSRGMLCSAAELGLEETSAGLLELDEPVAAGTDFTEYMKLDDTVFELDLTPNRADCFSVLGIARELAVIRGFQLEPPRQDAVAAAHARRFPVQVAEPRACPRYLARIAENVDSAARTPLWMKERLRRSGVRAVHPVVDVMNYVMLELGQPLHAFDLDKLEERIEVRYARSGESIEIIGGGRLEPDQRTLLIADARGPVALAGIIGGGGSAVSESTRNVLIECAFFSPQAVVGRARSYGLHTEASLRFERGVDRSLQRHALERACELLEQITGGEFGEVEEVAAPEPEPRSIGLRHDALVHRLGVEVDRSSASRILTHLGCRMRPCKGGWRCTPPPHRFDLEIEEDLIEEVGRIYGYDKITGGVSTVAVQAGEPLETARERNDRWSDRLVERGYFEVITYSFVEPEILAEFDRTPPLALTNAVSPATSVMRTSLWPGLLKTLQHNLNRQQERVRIFEAGRCFAGRDERLMLAGLVHGGVRPEQWGEASRACDFYDLKGDVESLFAGSPTPVYERSTHRGLHPGQAADVVLDGKRIGCLGALSPPVAQRLGVSREVFLFELDLGALPPPGVARFEAISPYPSVRRDISIAVPPGVGAERIAACIRGLGLGLLRDIVFFDVYEDEKMEEGRKSMALGLIFQDVSSTLSDEVCAKLVDKVVAALSQSLKINLRN